MPPAPLAVAVEVRALDVGTELRRAFRLSTSVGEDGVDLESPLPFEAGRPVAAELTLPDGDAAPIRATGRVADVRPDGEEGDPLPRRIVFTALSAEARQRLARYVSERMLAP